MANIIEELSTAATLATTAVESASTAIEEASTAATSVQQVVETSKNNFTQAVKNFSLEKLIHYGDSVAAGLLQFLGDLVVAGLILFIGFKVAKKVTSLVENFLRNRLSLDEGVVRFLRSFTNLGLKTIVVFWAVTRLGVAGSTIIALFGSATITIGLALQGSLSNIAGGVLILLLKPFQVGDYIVEDNSKNEGTVKDIDLFYTRLQTIDNKTVVIPNGVISNCSLTNVTKEQFRRIDLIIGIEYSQDIDQVRQIFTDIVRQEEKVLQDREIMIFVSEFASSCVEMGLRFWVAMDDYWTVRWDVLEKIKKRFDAEGISIPFNQLDVRIHQNGGPQ
jgi:small conductance mechanosensitive channel